MQTAILTSKGQITWTSMRDKLRLRPGSKVIFEQPIGDFVVRRKTGEIRDLKGFLKVPAVFAPTWENLDPGIAKAVVEPNLRSRQ